MTGGSFATLLTVEAVPEATCKVLLDLKEIESHENAGTNVSGYLKTPRRRPKSKHLSPVP